MADGNGLDWRKSGFCGSSACVEVAISADAVLVRDAADRDGGQLTFERAGWAAFMAELAAGRLARPPA
jgi:hypothetical protein